MTNVPRAGREPHPPSVSRPGHGGLEGSTRWGQVTTTGERDEMERSIDRPIFAQTKRKGAWICRCGCQIVAASGDGAGRRGSTQLRAALTGVGEQEEDATAGLGTSTGISSSSPGTLRTHSRSVGRSLRVPGPDPEAPKATASVVQLDRSALRQLDSIQWYKKNCTCLRQRKAIHP